MIFTVAQIEDFLRVSGDTNPLHSDDDFARRAGFERRVVPGMLSTLLAIPNTHERSLTGMWVKFKQPLYPDVDYVLNSSMDRCEYQLPEAPMHDRVVIRPDWPVEIESEFESKIWPLPFSCPSHEYQNLPSWQSAILICCSRIAGNHLAGSILTRVAIEFTWPQSEFIPEVPTLWDGQMFYRYKVAFENPQWRTINLIAEFLHGSQRVAIASMDVLTGKATA